MKKKDIFLKKTGSSYSSLNKIIILIIIVLLGISVYSSFLRLKSSMEIVDKEKEKVEKLKKEGSNLDDQLKKVQSEAYIEKQLRDKLQLAKEGEIVIILPDEETVKKFAPEIVTQEEVHPIPNWKKWLRLFEL